MTFLIFGILAIIVGFAVIGLLADNSSDTFWGVMICILGGMFVGLSITEIKQEDLPTPLDVYRGKTTLEITYKDSVAIDSVVVFKNK